MKEGEKKNESYSESELSGTCFICKQSVLSSEKVVPGKNTTHKIISCSIERGDEKTP